MEKKPPYEIRPYQVRDFEGIVAVSNESLQIPVWKNYYPNGWDKSRIAREFLIDPETKELVLKIETDPLLLVAEEDSRVVGVIVAQSLASFLEEVPHVSQEIAKKCKVEESYCQRHIALSKSAKYPHCLFGLFRDMKKYAFNKNYTRLVVGVPPKNEVGLELMNRFRYGEFFRDTSDVPVPLVYFSQKLE